MCVPLHVGNSQFLADRDGRRSSPDLNSQVILTELTVRSAKRPRVVEKTREIGHSRVTRVDIEIFASAFVNVTHMTYVRSRGHACSSSPTYSAMNVEGGIARAANTPMQVALKHAHPSSTSGHSLGWRRCVGRRVTRGQCLGIHDVHYQLKRETKMRLNKCVREQKRST